MGSALLVLVLAACTSSMRFAQTSQPVDSDVVEAGPTSNPLSETPPATDKAHATATGPVVGSEASATLQNVTSLQIMLSPIVTGLNRPVAITHAGDGSGRLFIVEKAGLIRILDQGLLTDVPFLDITHRVGSSASEQGLLGLAFHPRYRENGYFYVNYTDRAGDTVISRFTRSSSPELADPGSETVILTQRQPAANHNGGHLAFGPDGYLYIGLGDGGLANDAFGNGQNPRTLLGKMLRIDIDDAGGYAIPPDNPFINTPGARPEIWATGLRNPWRYSFDRLNGDLYIADVGQGTYEEINLQPAGSAGGTNYGWPIMEGLHCFLVQNCDQMGLTLPVTEYDHSEGCAVTGGYVYRGRAYPALAGIYLFGDYCSGIIWGLGRTNDGIQLGKLAQSGLQLSSFGEDEAGELYVVDYSGAVYLVSANSDQ